MTHARSLALVLAALASCGRSGSKLETNGSAVIGGDDGGRRRSTTGSGDSAGQAEVHPIPISTPELVVALVDDWTSTTATVRRYRRWNAGADATTSASEDAEDYDSPWLAVGEPWPAVVGRSGVAWGDGLHGLGAPAGRPGPTKREGDGASPAGSFAIRAGYGYAPPASTAFAFTRSTDDTKCVDDPASTSYASIVDRARVTRVDWTSAEDMRRTDEQYRWVLDLAHNAARTPNHGSCIFLHVWAGPDSTTSGCTAMEERALRALVHELPAGGVFVLLPKSEYAALRAPWHLP